MWLRIRLIWTGLRATLYFGTLVIFAVSGAGLLFGQDAGTVRLSDAGDPGKIAAVNATPFFAVPAYLLRTYPFADSAGKIRLEVRFGLVNDILQFERISAGRYRASYEANLAIFDPQAASRGRRTWRRDLEVVDFSATNDRAQLNLESAVFRLAPGNYQLHIEIVDLHTRRRLRRQYPLDLPDFRNGRLQLSALILGEGRQDSVGSARLVNGNLPALLQFGKPQQILYYEIYGAPEADLLTADYTIFSGTGDTLASWSKTLIATGGTLTCVESLDDRMKLRSTQRHMCRLGTPRPWRQPRLTLAFIPPWRRRTWMLSTFLLRWPMSRCSTSVRSRIINIFSPLPARGATA
jgi:hypothetical protein